MNSVSNDQCKDVCKLNGLNRRGQCDGNYCDCLSKPGKEGLQRLHSNYLKIF